ncbi:MAG: T9SS type A sorting domain-containing protein [Candidatus Cloacimonetes bacterium]|nr:T9SS type A sorting domain-containing protein [Candidatus Cloacimonadota bacterium]
MKSNKFIILFFLIILIFINLKANQKEAARIWMEGEFDDWVSIATIYSDTSGDQQSGDIDFGDLKIANDNRFVYFYLEIGAELNLQDQNEITLYLDTDNDTNTGTTVNGIGAEVKWIFGERQGSYYSRFTIYHQYIGLVTAPTVTSDRFEIAIDRDKILFGQQLFPDNSFRVVFHDNGPGEDYLPNIGETVTYSFDNSSLPPLNSISLQKAAGSDFRVMTYNVLSNNLFEPDLSDEFDRIFSAADPDIIGLEEIYDKTPDQVKQKVESMLASSPGEEWYCDGIAGDDVFAVSRYPIIESYALNKSGAFLIDLTPQIDSNLLLFVSHLSFGDYNEERQLEIDEMMAFIREAKEPGGILTLEENTPILIIGDLNLVGYAQQLETLLTGEIVNDQFGPSFSPDWDSSDFADLCARSTDLPMYYTWYSEYSSYSPGRLDFMIYSDYVLSSERKFVMFTPEMQADTLSAYDLNPDDVTNASDHVPLISDFKVSIPASASTNPLNDPIKLWNTPNPFSDYTQIKFSVPDYLEKLQLRIYNIKGEKVKSYSLKNKEEKFQSVTWNRNNSAGKPVMNGVYFYQLTTENICKTNKLLIVH